MDRIGAQRILNLLDLKPERHRVLEANLDSFLASSPPSGALESRQELGDWLFRTGNDLMRRADEGEPGAREQSRMFEKLRRDIRKPYSDQEVGEHVVRLDGDFEAFKAGLPAYPREFLAFGSAATGSFGVHSDLDFFFADATEQRKPATHGGAVGYGRGPEQFAGLKAEVASGAAPDLVPMQGSARQLILGRLAERGIRLAEGPHGWTATRVSSPAA